MTQAGFKSLRWADLYLYSIIDPRGLLKQIRTDKSWAFPFSFTVPAFVALAEIITVSSLGSQTPFFYYKISYGWILLFLYLVLKIVTSSALMDMLSQFMGNDGRTRETICLMNYSLFPKLFLLPLVSVFRVINFAPLFFYMFISMALFLWSAVIAVQGLSEMHSEGTGRALLIYIFPWLFVGVLLFFMGLLSLIYLFGFIFS